MTLKDIVSTIYYICATVGLVAVVGKLMYGWFRSDQIGKQFIEDMAEKHLPHIYLILMRLQIKNNLQITTAPSINFSHLKDKK